VTIIGRIEVTAEGELFFFKMIAPGGNFFNVIPVPGLGREAETCSIDFHHISIDFASYIDVAEPWLQGDASNGDLRQASRIARA
jgi:hypothetical protein